MSPDPEAALTLIAREACAARHPFSRALADALDHGARLKGASEALAREITRRVYREAQAHRFEKPDTPPIWASVNGKGKLNATMDNLLALLKHDPRVAETHRWNAFEGQLEVGCLPPPWMDDCPEGTVIEDFHVTHGLGWLTNPSMTGFVIAEPPSRKWMEAILAAAKRWQHYHPLQCWLRSLVWDGQERVDTFWASVTKSPPTHYLSVASWMFLLGLISRAMTPGCAFDYCFLLSGPQHHFKSSVLRLMGHQWFSDTPLDFASKDRYQHLRGVWLHESPEQLRTRGSTEAHKGFLSERRPKYRPAYERFEVKEPLSTVHCETTNHREVLHDETGNRRYIPIDCPVALDIDWVTTHRDACYAEALQRWDEGMRIEQWQRSLIELQSLVLPDFEDRDARCEYLSLYLDGALPGQVGAPTPPVKILTIAQECFRCLDLPDKRLQNEIGRMLRWLGWRQKSIWDALHRQSYRAWMPPESTDHQTVES